VAPFAAEGLVRARMWLERPTASYREHEYRGRRVYTEKAAVPGVVEMRTRDGSSLRREPAVASRLRWDERPAYCWRPRPPRDRPCDTSSDSR